MDASGLPPSERDENRKRENDWPRCPEYLRAPTPSLPGRASDSCSEHKGMASPNNMQHDGLFSVKVAPHDGVVHVASDLTAINRGDYVS
jgi:hypothetical protein